MTEQLSYKFLDKKKLLVIADKNTSHKSFLQYLNGTWSEDNDGWIISKSKEKEIKDFIANQKLKTISSDIKSRKTQDKYRREVSESESSSDSSDDVRSRKSSSGSESEIDPRILKMLEEKEKEKQKKETAVSKLENEEIEKRKLKEKTKFEDYKSEFNEKDKKLKKKYMSEDPMLYYKSFNTQPKNFKKINNYESDDNLSVSSSSCSSSSSDSFPSPRTPKKRRNYNKGLNNENYEEMIGEMKSLSRRIIELELENKKLKSKNK